LDTEPNTAEGYAELTGKLGYDELAGLLFERQLKVLPFFTDHVAQASILKRRSTKISSFLAGLAVSAIFWSLVLIVLDVPITTAALTLVATLLFARAFWLLGTLAKLLNKLLNISKSGNILQFLAAKSVILLWGGLAFIIFFNTVAVWAALRLVSDYTGDNILNRLYYLLASILESIPFGNILLTGPRYSYQPL
jgi:hypothetical protein